MSFSQSIIVCLSKYIDFTGRASRSEFWWFQLFVLLVQIPFGILLNVLEISSFIYATVNILSYILAGLFFLPNITVTSRRLHDIDRSGWWQVVPWGFGATYYTVALLIGENHIIALLSLMGAGISALVLLFLLTRKSALNHNKYDLPNIEIIEQPDVTDQNYSRNTDLLLDTCPHCNANIGEDYVFCITCGREIRNDD